MVIRIKCFGICKVLRIVSGINMKYVWGGITDSLMMMMMVMMMAICTIFPVRSGE